MITRNGTVCNRGYYVQKQKINAVCINRDLLSELLSHLNEVKKGRPLAVLIDGADLVHDARGQRTSDWIPQRIPKVRQTLFLIEFTDPLGNIM